MNPIPKTRAIALLQQKIDEIPALQAAAEFSEAFTRWRTSTDTVIVYVFGSNSRQRILFAQIQFSSQFAIVEADDDDAGSSLVFLDGLRTARATLQAMIDEIQTFWPDDAPTAPSTPPASPPDARKVFLVHGRDEAAKATAARFLEHLGLEPVILSERPNGGKTLIEKFEQEANQVGYAIVLFTPDDIGGLQSADEQQARARQNVLFELGYFAGRLGRERVCILNVPGVEIPSDLFGVAYVFFDPAGGDWKLKLIGELKNAGFDIDANKAFS